MTQQRPRPEARSREDIMRNSRTRVSKFLIVAASLIVSTAAFAGEQVLEFKLVTKAIDPKVVQASNIEGQTMSTSNAFGVAFFKDGRVAAKDFSRARWVLIPILPRRETERSRARRVRQALQRTLARRPHGYRTPAQV